MQSKQGYSAFLRQVSFVLIQTFILQEMSFAAPEFKPKAFDLFPKTSVSVSFPESVAVIEDAYKGEGKTLYLLQDAHTNESGQLNLARAIDSLLKQENNLKTVFTEAGVGDNSLSFLRAYKTQHEREAVALSLVKKGTLHGAEFLDLTSDDDFKIWGVESPDLYRKALEDYKAVAKERERFQNYLSKIDVTIETLKPSLLNPSLRLFDLEARKYEKGETTLTDYFEILEGQAANANISLKDYPHLGRLKDLKEKESRIDFKKANEEQLRAVQSLSAADRKELEDFASSKANPSKLSGQDQKEEKAFYAFLEEKTAAGQYPALAAYFEYLKLAREINAKALLSETKSLEAKLYEALTQTEDEKLLVKCSKINSYLHKLFNLTLMPEEFLAYQSETRDFSISYLTGYLNKKIMDLKMYYERTLFLEKGFDEIAKHAEDFYTLTLERDRYFIKQTLEKMDEDSQNEGILVAGGYHASNLKALLKEKNISFVSVTPQVLRETNQKRYETLLLNQVFANSQAPAPIVTAPQSTIMLAQILAGGALPTVYGQAEMGGRPEPVKDILYRTLGYSASETDFTLAGSRLASADRREVNKKLLKIETIRRQIEEAKEEGRSQKQIRQDQKRLEEAKDEADEEISGSRLAKITQKSKDRLLYLTDIILRAPRRVPKELSSILEELSSPDPVKRYQAVLHLAQVTDPKLIEDAVYHLGKSLSDKLWEVREEAREGLNSIRKFLSSGSRLAMRDDLEWRKPAKSLTLIDLGHYITASAFARQEDVPSDELKKQPTGIYLKRYIFTGVNQQWAVTVYDTDSDQIQKISVARYRLSGRGGVALDPVKEDEKVFTQKSYSIFDLQSIQHVIDQRMQGRGARLSASLVENHDELRRTRAASSFEAPEASEEGSRLAKQSEGLNLYNYPEAELFDFQIADYWHYQRTYSTNQLKDPDERAYHRAYKFLTYLIDEDGKAVGKIDPKGFTVADLEKNKLFVRSVFDRAVKEGWIKKVNKSDEIYFVAPSAQKEVRESNEQDGNLNLGSRLAQQTTFQKLMRELWAELAPGDPHYAAIDPEEAVPVANAFKLIMSDDGLNVKALNKNLTEQDYAPFNTARLSTAYIFIELVLDGFLTIRSENGTRYYGYSDTAREELTHFRTEKDAVRQSVVTSGMMRELRRDVSGGSDLGDGARLALHSYKERIYTPDTRIQLKGAYRPILAATSPQLYYLITSFLRNLKTRGKMTPSRLLEFMYDMPEFKDSKDSEEEFKNFSLQDVKAIVFYLTFGPQDESRFDELFSTQNIGPDVAYALQYVDAAFYTIEKMGTDTFTFGELKKAFAKDMKKMAKDSEQESPPIEQPAYYDITLARALNIVGMMAGNFDEDSSRKGSRLAASKQTPDKQLAELGKTPEGRRALGRIQGKLRDIVTFEDQHADQMEQLPRRMSLKTHGKQIYSIDLRALQRKIWKVKEDVLRFRYELKLSEELVNALVAYPAHYLNQINILLSASGSRLAQDAFDKLIDQFIKDGAFEGTGMDREAIGRTIANGLARKGAVGVAENLFGIGQGPFNRLEGPYVGNSVDGIARIVERHIKTASEKNSTGSRLSASLVENRDELRRTRAASSFEAPEASEEGSRLAAATAPQQILNQVVALKSIIVIPTGALGVDKTVELAKTAMSLGIGAEPTFRGTAEQLVAVLKELREYFPDAPLAAGTVTTLEQAKIAIEAGANVIVTPGVFPEIIQYVQSHGALIVPGVSDPDEAAKAIKAGAIVLKYFPPALAGANDAERVANFVTEMKGPLGTELAAKLDNLITAKKINFIPFSIHELKPETAQIASYTRLREYLLRPGDEPTATFYVPMEWGLTGYLGEILEKNPDTPVIVTSGDLPTEKLQAVKNSHPQIVQVGVVTTEEAKVLEMSQKTFPKFPAQGSRLAATQLEIIKSRLSSTENRQTMTVKWGDVLSIALDGRPVIKAEFGYASLDYKGWYDHVKFTTDRTYAIQELEHDGRWLNALRSDFTSPAGNHYSVHSFHKGVPAFIGRPDAINENIIFEIQDVISPVTSSAHVQFIGPKGKKMTITRTAEWKPPTVKLNRDVIYDTLSRWDGSRLAQQTQQTALQVMAEGMRKIIKKAELLIPKFYFGNAPLNWLSKISMRLDAASQASIDAYKELIRIAFMSKKSSPKEIEAALDDLRSPTRYMRQWLHELDISPEDFKEAIFDATQIDKDNDISQQIWQRASKLGLLRLKIPKEYGGLDLNQREYGQVLEVLAPMSASFATAISAHSTVGAAPLILYGTEAQKKKYLTLLAKGESLAAFALTEPRAGTDLNSLQTTATLSADGKTWKLNGDKFFISNITDAGLAYVIAGHTYHEGSDKDLGQTVFIVELPFRTNESWETKKGKLAWFSYNRHMRITPFTTHEGLEMSTIRGSDQGLIQMRNFEVPAENMLGSEGKGKMIPLLSLNKGRAAFGPFLTGIVEWVVAKAKRWAVGRPMFGKRQADMQSAQNDIGAMRINETSLKALNDLTAALIDANPDSGIATLSAIAKVYSSEKLWETIQKAMRLGGGHPLVIGSPQDLQRVWRDSWVMLIVEGVNPALAQLVHLIGGVPMQKEIVTLGGALKFVLRQIINRFIPFVFVEKGVLPITEARWLQSRTAQFAWRFGATAGRIGLSALFKEVRRTKNYGLLRHPIREAMNLTDEHLGERQNVLLQASKVLMDLYALTAVELRLAQEADTLSAGEKRDLKAAVAVLKLHIDEEMRWIRPSGKPIDNIQTELGRQILEEEAARQTDSPSSVDEQIKFYYKEANAFYAQFGQEPWNELAGSRLAGSMTGEFPQWLEERVQKGVSYLQLNNGRRSRQLLKDEAVRMGLIPGRVTYELNIYSDASTNWMALARLIWRMQLPERRSEFWAEWSDTEATGSRLAAEKDSKILEIVFSPADLDSLLALKNTKEKLLVQIKDKIAPTMTLLSKRIAGSTNPSLNNDTLFKSLVVIFVPVVENAMDSYLKKLAKDPEYKKNLTLEFVVENEKDGVTILMKANGMPYSKGRNETHAKKNNPRQFGGKGKGLKAVRKTASALKWKWALLDRKRAFKDEEGSVFRLKIKKSSVPAKEYLSRIQRPAYDSYYSEGQRQPQVDFSPYSVIFGSQYNLSPRREGYYGWVFWDHQPRGGYYGSYYGARLAGSVSFLNGSKGFRFQTNPYGKAVWLSNEEGTQLLHRILEKKVSIPVAVVNDFVMREGAVGLMTAHLMSLGEKGLYEGTISYGGKAPTITLKGPWLPADLYIVAEDGSIYAVYGSDLAKGARQHLPEGKAELFKNLTPSGSRLAMSVRLEDENTIRVYENEQGLGILRLPGNAADIFEKIRRQTGNNPEDPILSYSIPEDLTNGNTLHLIMKDREIIANKIGVTVVPRASGSRLAETAPAFSRIISGLGNVAGFNFDDITNQLRVSLSPNPADGFKLNLTRPISGEALGELTEYLSGKKIYNNSGRSDETFDRDVLRQLTIEYLTQRGYLPSGSRLAQTPLGAARLALHKFTEEYGKATLKQKYPNTNERSKSAELRALLNRMRDGLKGSEPDIRKVLDGWDEFISKQGYYYIPHYDQFVHPEEVGVYTKALEARRLLAVANPAYLYEDTLKLLELHTHGYTHIQETIKELHALLQVKNYTRFSEILNEGLALEGIDQQKDFMREALAADLKLRVAALQSGSRLAGLILTRKVNESIDLDHGQWILTVKRIYSTNLVSIEIKGRDGQTLNEDLTTNDRPFEFGDGIEVSLLANDGWNRGISSIVRFRVYAPARVRIMRSELISDEKRRDGESGSRLTPNIQTFLSQAGTLVLNGVGARLALAEEPEHVKIFDLEKKGDELLVEVGGERYVLNTATEKTRPVTSVDVQNKELNSDLTDNTAKLIALNNANSEAAQSTEEAVYLVHLASFKSKAELQNLLIQQNAQLSLKSVVSFIGSDAEVDSALALVSDLRLKKAEQFVGLNSLSASYEKAPHILLIKQGQTLSQNLTFSNLSTVTLESDKPGKSAVFAFGAIQLVMAKVAQGDIPAAFDLYLNMAPQYRGVMTLQDFQDFLAGKRESVAKFPLPATIWASFQDAVRLYQLSRTVGRSA